MSDRPRFHLAFPVDDLDATRHFYVEVLGCSEGRSAEHWIDFDLYGHQIVAHLSREVSSRLVTNAVDGDDVPVPHFGALLGDAEFQQLAARLHEAEVAFVIEPHIRFAGLPGEQWTMFFLDPAGNALEFKSFSDDGQVFSTG